MENTVMRGMLKGAPLIAVLTGASRGLGAAILQHLVALGYIVVTLQRSKISNTTVRSIVVDLSDCIERDKCVTRLVDELPYVDLLVNNAGMCGEDAEVEWDKVMEVNFHAVVELTEGLWGLLQGSRDGGRVVNISSGDGELCFFEREVAEMVWKLGECERVEEVVSGVVRVRGTVWRKGGVWGGQTAYRLSKGCLNGYCRFLERRGEVDVVAVCPGDVDTGMKNRGVVGISGEDAVRRMRKVFEVGAREGGGFWRFGERIAW